LRDGAEAGLARAFQRIQNIRQGRFVVRRQMACVALYSYDNNGVSRGADRFVSPKAEGSLQRNGRCGFNRSGRCIEPVCPLKA
jgi:hypothetical protein